MPGVNRMVDGPTGPVESESFRDTSNRHCVGDSGNSYRILPLSAAAAQPYSLPNDLPWRRTTASPIPDAAPGAETGHWAACWLYDAETMRAEGRPELTVGVAR